MALFDLRPRLGRRSGRPGERFLLVCFYDPNGISTVYENIALWQQLSRYNIEVLNLWPGGRGQATLAIPSAVDLEDYAGLVVHCTASYFPANLYGLDIQLDRPFEQYGGLKILMKQDEQVQTDSFPRYIQQKKFDLVITCVPPQEREKVYPRDVVGDVTFLQTLTGYVSPYMREFRAVAMADRQVGISYRGSVQPLEFGRLGFEKRKIGYDVASAAARVPRLAVDISSRWEDRIFGTAWFDFLGHSKAVLGVESGSNLFDFTGEVAQWCRQYEAEHRDADALSEAFYLDAHGAYLHRFEGNVNYAQISPRHFEAAATRSAQVLYEGSYSGVLIPYRHFLPVRRDLSNFQEVIDFVRDDRRLSDLADRTYEEVVLNPQYHYEHFVASFDSAAESALQKKGRPSTRPQIALQSKKRRQRAVFLMAHEPALDPRIEWVASGLAQDFEVCEIGTYRFGVDGQRPTYEQVSEHRMRVRIERSRQDWDWVPTADELENGGATGIQILMMLYMLAEVPSGSLTRLIGALDATGADLNRFRSYCKYFVRTNGALLQAARLIGTFDLVVATDLETLPAATVLGNEYKASVLFDAHEYWPYSVPDFRHWEVQFWGLMERTLAKHADIRVTVSPHLADLMSREYDCKFLSVPNCVPAGTPAVDLESALRRRAERNETLFLYLGTFAPFRGLEDLIEAWSDVNERAWLLLRGPDNPYKETMIDLARSLGLLDRSVFFPPAVAEDALIRTAMEADVGMIPYKPENIIYRYCCPNKLSQYMAAGLPIICNDLDFVKSVVVGNGIGAAVAFNDRGALRATINRFANSREEIAAMSRKAYELYRTSFNWQTVSGDMYEQLRAAIDSAPRTSRPEPDFSWIEHGCQMRKSAIELGSVDPVFPQSNEVYEAEIARLNQVYAAEIARLNEVYPAEIARLKEVYLAETSRLNEVYLAEIARQKSVGAARINRTLDANFVSAKGLMTIAWLNRHCVRAVKYAKRRLRAFLN